MSTATITKADPWQWWRDALAGNRQPIDSNYPEQGYYRAKTKDGGLVLVAYWWEGKDRFCCWWGDRASGKELTDDAALERWPWVSKEPITEEVYNLVYEGGAWPDVDPEVQKQITAGHNNPPEQTPEEALLERIKNAVGVAVQYQNIADDDAAGAAAGLRNLLNELGNNAEKERVREIGDHYDIYMSAHRKWKPWVDQAKETAQKIRGYLTAWEKKKAQKAEAERLAREAAERAAAEEAQREADRQIAEGTPPSEQEAPHESFAGESEAPPIAPAIVPQERAQIKAGYGRAAAVVMVKVPKIIDQNAVYAAFREWPEVKTLLEKLVKQQIRAGKTVPGVEITEEPDVR